MGKITYADKVGIVPKEVHVNQWWDDDANELKGAVNDNDDRITVLETGSDTLIDVSAEWTSGLSFNVTADNFPVDGTYYSNTASVVTLDAADPTLDRIDLIVANKNGTNGFVKGTAATNPAEPDFDPSEVYPIKFVLINGAATTPSDTSTELVFDEDLGTPTEWAFSSITGDIVVSTNDAFSGTKSVEATNVNSSDYFLLTNNTTLQASDIGTLSFYIKLKEDLGNSYFFIRFFNGSNYVGRYYFRDGQNGLNGSDTTNWQKISITGSKLNLPEIDFDTIQFYAFKTFDGYFFDLCNINVGSGNDITIVGVEEAPDDGKIYGRKDKQWVEIIQQKEVTSNYTVLETDYRKTIWLNSATAITVTVDNDLPENFECQFYNVGVGTVTFSAGTATLDAPDGNDLITDKVATLIKYLNNNDYKLKGELQ